MELVLDDVMKFAYVNDWDQDGWDAQSGNIPWDYTMQFNPIIPDFQIALLNTGRELWYTTITVYTTTWNGTTMVSIPMDVVIQRLLPLPSDPNATPSGDTSTT